MRIVAAALLTCGLVVASHSNAEAQRDFFYGGSGFSPGYGGNFSATAFHPSGGWGGGGWGGGYPGWGGRHPGWGGWQPGGGGWRPGWGWQQPGWGGWHPGWGWQQPGWGGWHPGWGWQAGWGWQQPGWGHWGPGWGYAYSSQGVSFSYFSGYGNGFGPYGW